MIAIDKLIFNQLARRKGVNLPEIGSLGVRFRPAFRRGRRIESPVNQVVFSRREYSVWPALPALIEREASTDAASAQQYYAHWLSQARQQDGTIVIDGVGTIKNGIFIPSPDLKSTIDRGYPPSSVRIRRRRKPLYVLLSLLAIAILGIVALICMRPVVVSRLAAPIKQFTKTIWHPFERNPMAVDSAKLAIIYGDTSGQVGFVDPAQQGQDDSVRTGSPSGIVAAEITDTPVYHLVAGVFSTEENADRFIAESKKRSETFTYRKTSMRNGRIVVSIFSSADHAETDRKRMELRSSMPDLWIYTEP